MSGELPVDLYISEEFNGIENVNKTVEALHAPGGCCLRAVLNINEVVYKQPQVPAF